MESKGWSGLPRTMGGPAKGVRAKEGGGSTVQENIRRGTLMSGGTWISRGVLMACGTGASELCVPWPPRGVLAPLTG